MTEQTETVAVDRPVLKAASAWGAAGVGNVAEAASEQRAEIAARAPEWLAAIGITSWGEAAAAAAFVYTMSLLGQFWWRTFWRPYFERCGVVRRLRRRKSDRDGWRE